MTKGFFTRLIACGVLVGLGFGALTVKLFVIQIRDRDRLVAHAERQLRRTLHVRAKRGDVLDRKGRPLAVSMDAPSLYANPQEVGNPSEAAWRLSNILGLPRRKLKRKLSRGGRYVWIRRKITPGEKSKILGLNLSGLGFVTESRRFYPKRELASSLLGFVGVDDIGLAGMELVFEKKMKGRPGRIRIERDAKGRSVHPEANIVKSPEPGADVRLTIDEVIQYIVEKELRLQLERTGARKAIGVIAEPSTGRILAIATVPGYNPNAYSRYSPVLWKQAAVQNVYEPGSTFKIVTAAAYLNSGKKLTKKYYAEEGGYRIGTGRFVLHDTKKFGWLTAEQIIVKSSNIGTYKMAKDVGAGNIYKMARQFGFGSKTGVSFPGESRGILRPPKIWSRTSLAAISIGQEVSVTPLQLVMAFAAIANGGILRTPRLVDKVERGGRALLLPKLSAPRRVFAPKVAQRLAALLRKVVTVGTGRAAEVPGYGSAGKTGTAQKADRGTRGYSKSKFITSFAGFVPYENPRIALLVMFDEGNIRGEAWGSTIAAPVWKRIAWQTMRYLRVPPKDAHVVNLKKNVFPSSNPPLPERVSLSEEILSLAEKVRSILHGPPAPRRSMEQAP